MKTIAQLTFIPLATHNPTEEVRELIEHVAQYDVKVEIGYLSTTVIGETDVVFSMVKDVYDTMSLDKGRFRFHVEFLSPEDQ